MRVEEGLNPHGNSGRNWGKKVLEKHFYETEEEVEEEGECREEERRSLNH